MTARDALARDKYCIWNSDIFPCGSEDTFVAGFHAGWAAARAEALEEAAQKCERLAAINPRPSKQAAAHVLADAIRALMVTPA